MQCTSRRRHLDRPEALEGQRRIRVRNHPFSGRTSRVLLKQQKPTSTPERLNRSASEPCFDLSCRRSWLVRRPKN